MNTIHYIKYTDCNGENDPRQIEFFIRHADANTRRKALREQAKEDGDFFYDDDIHTISWDELPELVKELNKINTMPDGPLIGAAAEPIDLP